MRLLRVLLLCGCLLASEAEETAVERKAEKLLQRALQITAGERKLRRSPQTWRREPPPAAQRPLPRGSWR